MDTKLKNNKKMNLFVTGVLISLSAVIFMAMYPVFEKEAKEYEVDVLMTEDFLQELYQANFVLYENLQELVKGKEIQPHELFLSIEEKPTGTGNMEPDEEDYEETVKQSLDAILGYWQSSLLDGLAQKIDYCMVDEVTGKCVKNTENKLENLGTEEADEALRKTYAGYIQLCYGDGGMLESVSVKGKDADALLKKVQSTMKNSYVHNELGGYIHAAGFYEGKITLENGPTGVRVCYAMTEDQLAALSKSGSYQEWNQFYAYYQAGTPDFFRAILVVLLICGLLLPLWKRYTLHESSLVKLHLEFSLMAGVFWFAVSSELVLYLVNYTNSGYWNEWYGKYIPIMPVPFYPVLTGLLNYLALTAMLVIWYYLATSLGDIFSLGIKGFICERSLIVKLWQKTRKFAKESKVKFKEEILHVNLGEAANKMIFKLVAVNFAVLTIVCFLWMFGWFALVVYSVLLYFGLKKYVQKIQQQYGKVLAATQSIAEGNLNTSLNEDFGVFESYKEELSAIQTGFKKAVDEEVKSQRMKTELITNVSHDLKTPLTAITTYVELLEDENLSPEKRKEYLEILKKKSARLKFLIEDLFEISKASSGNVILNPVDVDICNLIRQVYLEYEDKVEEADLIFRFALSQEKIILKLDSQKTYRIFENLFTNAIKYAMPHTRVYVTGVKTEKGFRFEMKNMSAYELNIDPKELTERFVRGDKSRNTEGSGLGLAIARSFTQLQGGDLKVEIDGDLFKVTVTFECVSCWNS